MRRSLYRRWILGFVLSLTVAAQADVHAAEPAPTDRPCGVASGPPLSARNWREEIIYVVIVQKFFNGNPANDVMARRFGPEKDRYSGGLWGGDLEGVIAKLDYLSGLGVTTLLLYPVMANDSEPLGKYLAPGYRPKDYFRVDENFGDLGTLQRLVNLAHQRQMRVILDLPLGMPGVEHPFCHDPAKAGWFGPPTAYGVRQWNADEPQVAAYLIEVSKFWQQQSGCDGFRLDSAQLHSVAFWKRYVAAIKSSQCPNFFLLAELPLHPREIGSFLTATGLDSAYDFSISMVQPVFGQGASVGRLSFVLRQAREFYPSAGRMCAQIDNYETPPFVTASGEPKEARLKLAMTFLLTIDRIPLIYPGDETALAYGDVGGLFDPARQNPHFLQYSQTLIALRKAERALRSGVCSEVQSHDPIYAFLRTAGDERVLALFNNSNAAQQVSFPLGQQAWRDVELYDLVARRVVKPRALPAPLDLEPFAARILKLVNGVP